MERNEKGLNNLKAIRKRKKLTRIDLQELSGIHHQTIEHIENGKCNIHDIKLSTLIKLAKALNTKVSKIVNEEERK